MSGAGKDKAPFFFPVINFPSDIVPNLGIFLPFINKAGNRPFQDQTRIDIHADSYIAIHIHPGRALSNLQGRFRLAASLGPLYQDGAGTFEPVLEVRIGKRFKVGAHNYLQHSNPSGKMSTFFMEIYYKIIWQFMTKPFSKKKTPD
jgi:hypothetical protein